MVRIFVNGKQVTKEELSNYEIHNMGILPKRSDADGKNLCERKTGDKRRTFEL
nr:MAG TPA: hypothetical protein [Caudoviricetes sp.]